MRNLEVDKINEEHGFIQDANGDRIERNVPYMLLHYTLSNLLDSYKTFPTLEGGSRAGGWSAEGLECGGHKASITTEMRLGMFLILYKITSIQHPFFY